MSSRFGPEVTADIIARIKQGVSFKDAAIAAGVKPETARGWLTRGRRQAEGPHMEFAGAAEEARAEAAELAAREMTPGEFDEHLATAVRAGSVQAMKLWAEIHLRGKRDDPPGDDLFDLT